jgi:hypothetical protein
MYMHLGSDETKFSLRYFSHKKDFSWYMYRRVHLGYCVMHIVRQPINEVFFVLLLTISTIIFIHITIIFPSINVHNIIFIILCFMNVVFGIQCGCWQQFCKKKQKWHFGLKWQKNIIKS